jgi:hypothetical protein
MYNSIGNNRNLRVSERVKYDLNHQSSSHHSNTQP